jgi:hypothetical protein
MGHELSICAIAKNEQDYLLEWCAFNKVIGIDHIYIYDNESEVPAKEVVKNYIEEGFVDVIAFPGKAKQMVSYSDCIANHKDDRWIAFIDIDEYICNFTNLSIKDILKEYEEYGGLQISWKLFGSNGQKTKPEGLTIENFTMASPCWWSENLHTKAICQPAKAVCFGDNPHFVRYSPPYYAVGEDFNKVPNAWAEKFCANKLQLNHYVVRSKQEFVEKIAKGRADSSTLKPKQLKDFDYFDKMSTEKDECALKYLDKVKEELYRISK